MSSAKKPRLQRVSENVAIDSLKTLDKYLSKQDNSKNSVYVCKIPEICKKEPCILGIDEAGRGPVLGPMVYGIAFCSQKDNLIIEAFGCQDSKALTEEKREEIFEMICKTADNIGWAVEVISPAVISKDMLSRCKVSLNQISMDSAIGLVKKALSAGANISEVYVDTVGPPEKYQAYLTSVFPKLKIIVTKKADAIFPIVSAASICAKVCRDHALQVWDFKENLKATYKDFGSGYPGGVLANPNTKRFLADNVNPVFGFPSIVRFSWSTAQTILDESAYRIDWENPDDQPNTPASNTAITSFFRFTKKDKPTAKHRFFSERFLVNTTEF